jgi:hypothetical protein
MNDEVKEIMIDLINYYNTMGTESDPGIQAFQNVARRASNVLEQHVRETRTEKSSADVDPFAITGEFPIYKLEDEW